LTDDDLVEGEGFDDSHPISKRQVKKEWHKQYPNKPMPKIEAYNVPEKDFIKTVQHNRKYGSRKGEVKEYGRKLPLNRTTGTLIKDESTNTYLILRRSNATGSSSRTVSHEIRHIAEKEGYGSTVHSKIGGGNMYQQGTIHRKIRQVNNPFIITKNVFGFNFFPKNLFGQTKRKHK
jgi:hypothetical protein